MHPRPSVAPSFGSGGTQRGNRALRLPQESKSEQQLKQHHHQHNRLRQQHHHQQLQHHHQHQQLQQQQQQHRHSRESIRRRRNSHESLPTGQLKYRLLRGLILFVVVAVAVLAYRGALRLSRARSNEAEGPTGTRRDEETYSHAHEAEGRGLNGEEVRLRKEVSALEDILLEKKALLGTSFASDALLKNSNNPADERLRGGGVWAAGSTRFVGLPSSIPDAKREPSATVKVGREEKPLVSAGGLGDDSPSTSVAGQAMFGLNPVRPSLESRRDLLREPVPLIVGGTDGSGTRGVVALLQRLKVPMVVEDTGTMDIHASPYMAKGGWPVVVRPVIEWAHGAGYDARDAPAGLKKTTVEALGNLKTQMNKSSAKLHSPVDGQGAKFVSWGFKAPVSMLLVPFFAEAWGKAKFLHVVRDGRDIAFSGNQTPVSKFYDDTFPKGTRAQGLKESSLKAIAMWNTWNVGLHDWAASKEERGVAGLDYLLLHTEDLIDPAAKFAAIKDVAEFVGSPLSDKELCCIATEGSKDMGSHTASRKERGQITSRFGKWKSKVEGDPGLSKRLHREGERGLRLFGYEPERSLRVLDGYQCPLEHDPTCPTFPPPSTTNRLRMSRSQKARTNTEVPADIVDTATCVGLVKEVDYKGYDIQVAATEEHLDCCQECRKLHGCTYFTFDYKSGNCYLKSEKGREYFKSGLVSGMVLVP